MVQRIVALERMFAERLATGELSEMERLAAHLAVGTLGAQVDQAVARIESACELAPAWEQALALWSRSQDAEKVWVNEEISAAQAYDECHRFRVCQDRYTTR